MSLRERHDQIPILNPPSVAELQELSLIWNSGMFNSFGTLNNNTEVTIIFKYAKSGMAGIPFSPSL